MLMEKKKKINTFGSSEGACKEKKKIILIIIPRLYI